MLTRKHIVTFMLLASFSLMELHQLAPAKMVNWFIASKDVQSVRWYVNDTCQAIIWLLVLGAVLMAKQKSQIRLIIWLHFAYRAFDLLMYWYDFRQSQWPYITIYVIITISIFELWKNIWRLPSRCFRALAGLFGG